MTTGSRVSTGVDGLDEVLDGGLLPGRSYMFSGAAGTGKTVLATQFLVDGVERGETGLFVSFEEREESIVENAARLGLDLGDAAFLDLSPDSEFFDEERAYDVFGADDLESGSVADRVRTAVKETDPRRVVLDGLTVFRRLSRDDYQFRATAASLLRYLTDRGATVAFTGGAGRAADDLEFVCDGHLRLSQAAKGRVLEVTKFRGSNYRSGQHTTRIDGDGMTVSPKLVPGSHERAFDDERISSGIDGLDAMTEGGINRGTVTVISGPSGVGKSTLGSHFLRQAAERGERSVIYLLEEAETTFTHRSEAIGVDVDEMVERGSLAVEEVETLTISADEFAARVRRQVERKDARVVMLDGISGYRLAIKGEDEAVRTELHALVRYLRNMGVTVVLTGETPLVTGNLDVSKEGISYLADNVVLLRYFEASGGLEKAIGVLKMRASDFERGLREFAITGDGVQVGDRLDRFRGVLTGVPERHE